MDHSEITTPPPAEGSAPAPDPSNASSLPSSISDLCAALGVTYTGVFVPCNYCRRTLSQVECVLFDHAECKLLWKNCTPNAICYYCLKILARFEFVCFHRNTCTAEKAEQMLRRPLSEFRIRCVNCLRRFQPEEIQQLREANCTIFVVGYKLRAQCFLCAMNMF